MKWRSYFRTDPKGDPRLSFVARSFLRLEQGLECLVEFFKRHFARIELSVDEECRGRIDLELGGGAVADFLNLVEQRRVVDAGVKGLLRKARLFGDGLERRD